MQGSPDATPEPEAIAGRVTEFVKVGDTVRRPATESSASVQQLLTHLEHAGFAGAPRFIAAESDGSIVLSWIEGWVPTDADPWLGDWPSTPDWSARIAALVGGYRLSAGQAHGLADMVVEVIAGCRRSVVRKIAAGIPAFVQMEREGILATLDSQHRAAEQHRTLVAQAAAA
ncbi:hypothetical protein [Candidatus Poriferisodalis sp.]|uniref:hypothetical protein n=1 Tax=Candidatus Poriferisodalis sp. TaxID=3101277 RepID=UPI003B58D086